MLTEDVTDRKLQYAEDRERIVYMDDQSRRINLRIRGVPEDPQETWEQCQAKVLRILRETLGIAPEVEHTACAKVRTHHQGLEMLL